MFKWARLLLALLLPIRVLAVDESSGEVLDPKHIVEMLAIGSQPEAAGLEGRESDVDVRSANGRLSATVLRRASVQRNQNEYSILIYRFPDSRTRASATVVVRASSASNDSALSSLTWLADNKTLAFLGMDSVTGLRQVFTVDAGTAELRQRTKGNADVLNYRIAADSSWIVVERDVNRHAQRSGSGMVVAPSTFLGDLLSGNSSQWPPVWSETRVLEYALYRGQSAEATWLSPNCFEAELLEVSPPGTHALYLCRTLGDATRQWSAFSPTTKWGQYAFLSVVDIRTGSGHPLLDAPLSTERPMIKWIGSDALAVGPIQLRSEQHGCRSDRSEGATMRVSLAPPFAYTLDCAAAGNASGKSTRATGVPGQVRIEHSLNTPSRLVAETSGRREVLVDTGEDIGGLLRSRVRVISGTLTNGTRWKAGLYEPIGEAARPPYPLVIQTHGFNEQYFAPQGVTTSGAAAQSLAENGIAVVQFDDTFAIRAGERESELLRAQEGYESVVEQLVREGLVDQNRIGIQGWSITGQHVYYALQHSQVLFAAALVNDAQVGGYFEKVAVQNVQPSYEHEGLDLYGADPEGTGLARWMNTSPGFNMRRVRAPVRIEANEVASVPFCWEAYSRLLEFKKPVELYLYFDGAHTLVKPAQRLTSIEASVDWFRFWLSGASDPAPGKRDQYKRWEELRRESWQSLSSAEGHP